MAFNNAFSTLKASEFSGGYSIISKLLREVLGFDVTLVVSACVLLFGLITAGKFVWGHAYSRLEDYLTSFVSVDSGDDIYNHVMGWVAEQPMSKNSRGLMVKTSHENAWDSQNMDMEEEGLNSDRLLNFSNWEAKVPPKFQPYYGCHRFFHNGRLFQFKREAKLMVPDWRNMFQEDETIELRCIGRSTQPIKNLIKECRDHHLEKEKSCTVVRRPASKEHRDRGRTLWSTVAIRPSRPIGTVVLDHAQKDHILTDINEYLHPNTPRWYANRGIPYRRGYLFHGPPGTGKSSLAWVIAGVFGLDIYCISLVEPTLTEEDLGLMFMTLPQRCVVLLEDIDSAGLVKRQERDEGDKLSGDDAVAKLGAEFTKAFKSVQAESEKTQKNNQGISLSGLLNAIDGVASHEGRVLIMTSNRPEELDEALIRPGRIDMKVGFTKATRRQICEIFIRMYSPDTSATTPPKAGQPEAIQIPANDIPCPPIKKPANGNNAASEMSKEENRLTLPQNQRSSPLAPVFTLSELTDIAKKFADMFDEETHTPAEIQGFLLTRKKDPNQALKDGEAWKDQRLKAKNEKSKIGPIQ